MKLPRFRIAWVMAFVALAALNFGALRAMHDLEDRLASVSVSHRLPRTIAALAMGALPMANVLVITLAIGLRRRGSRRFLFGFEVFGAAALALHVAAVSLYTEELIPPFVNLLRPIVDSLRNGPYMSTVSFLIVETTTATILLLPQLVFALVGGFLFRYYRIR